MTTQFSRRAFLKTASVIGGGLVLGVDLYCKKVSNENDPTPKGTFQPNVWLKIDKNNTITITLAKTEMGQGIYTALPMIIAEELEADWQTIKVEQALTHPKKYGSQTTGGSTSVRTLYSMLRKAGAAAREMLIEAAAKQWSVPKAECSAVNGTIVHPSSKRTIPFGELVDLASALPVPDEPPLKDPASFRLLKKKMLRIDTPPKVDGSATFGMDLKIPGMLYATVARPRTFGSTVQSFDAARTKSIAGVKDVVRAGDILAVIARSTYAAIQGREALSVTWTKSEYENQSTEAMWKQFEERANSEGDVERNEGDALSAYQNAAKKIDAIYYAPFVAHATMEPLNCTVHIHDGKCEIWAPSQTPQDAQSEAANILGMEIENVILHVTLLGGGFGRRLETDFVAEAVQVANAAQAPVKIVWTREDDMQHDFYRPSQYSLLRAGLDSSGSPVAWLHRIVGPNGKGLLTHASNPPYSFPNLRIDAQGLDTGIPTGPWRSVGASQNGFMIECFMDELAYAAGKDPYEYRRNLLSKTPRLKRALELAAEKSGWGMAMPKGKGRGIACVSGFGSHVAQVAEVTVSDSGNIRVDRVVVAIECGPYVNPDTIAAQMEGGVVFGLSATLKDEITIKQGGVQQGNFDDYRMLMIDEMPRVEVHIVDSNEAVGGVGEPGVPPIAPAVCNAIFAATGKRVRRLPVQLS